MRLFSLPPDWLARWTYDRLLKVLLFLIVLVACGLTPMQSDTWWQLRAGQDMWESHRFLHTDLYSHTAYGEFWLNHEWLAEVLYYGAYRIGGLAAVTLFAALLILGGWAITWRLASGAVRSRFIWILPALLPASLWWEPRPHAFSLLLLPASVLFMASGRYMLLPVVFLVWANCHGGVLLGLAVVTAGAVAQTIVSPRLWWRPALAIALSIVAITMTPLGWSFWLEIPRSLARIRLYPLDEWKQTPLLDMRLLPFWMLALAFCIAIVRGAHQLRQASLKVATVSACALALLPLAVMAIRNVGPFLMLATPVLSMLVPLPESSTRRREQFAFNFGVALVATLTVVTVLIAAYTQQAPRLRWHPIPDGAIRALRQCPDNLYNRYDEGGSLIWFVPERKVFLDGRQDPFSPALVLEHIGMEAHGADHTAVFERFGIRCAYLPTYSPTARRLIESGWSTPYHGPNWTVLTRPERQARQQH